MHYITFIGGCLLCVGILMLALVFYGNGKEHLEAISEPAPSHNIEGKQDEQQIQPTMFDAGSGTIMSGSEFNPTQFLSPWYNAYTGDMKNHYLLDDGAGGSAGLQFNMCSKSCCSEQYPLPFKMPNDEFIDKNKKEFTPTNYSCNNAWQDSGCVCMTNNQANFLGSRGGNA